MYLPPNRRKEQKTKEDKTGIETPAEPEPTAGTGPKAEPKVEPIRKKPFLINGSLT
jgi:hypothetical protein